MQRRMAGRRAPFSFASFTSITCLTGLIGAAFALPGCDSIEATSRSEQDAPFEWPAGPHPIVTLRVTEPEATRGEIVIELYPELAPKTVENFLDLAAQDFYDGTTFHRVLPGFMIQGGDPNTKDIDPNNDGEGGPRYRIDDEFNAAPHLRGTVSMANTGVPNSGGSQFFIIQEDSRDLDGHYTAFGRVVRGMDIVDRIAKAETDLVGRWGPKNRPLEKIVVGDVAIENPTPTADAATMEQKEKKEEGAAAHPIRDDRAALESWSDDTLRTATAEVIQAKLDSPRALEP